MVVLSVSVAAATADRSFTPNRFSFCSLFALLNFGGLLVCEWIVVVLDDDDSIESSRLSERRLTRPVC